MENEEKQPEWKPKGGRPRLAAREKRSVLFNLRLTGQERKDLEQLSTGAGYSDVSVYARRKLLTAADAPIHNPKELFQAIDKTGGALKRIGTNINQVARYVHYLEKNNMVEGKALAEFNRHFQQYLRVEEEYVKAIRAFLRTIH